ncbi:MAG: hypothetical protein ABIR37_00205 [Candidatus Saccharimonadales bacterium]
MNPSEDASKNDPAVSEAVVTPDDTNPTHHLETQEVPAELVETREHPPKITSPIFVSKNTTITEMVFSIGLASIFFVYAAIAYLQPESIGSAYSSNVLGKAIGHQQLAVETSMFINIFLGVLAFMKRWKMVVYGLAGGWLVIIAVFKVLNLLA